MQIANAVLDEVQEMFDRIDLDGDGYISFEEFTRLMLGMDSTRTESSLRASFEVIDTDCNGRVTFGEFRTWMSR